MNEDSPYTILGIDYGSAKTGIARANSLAKLPEPITTLVRPSEFVQEIQELVKVEQAGIVVVGIPVVASGVSQQQQKASEFVTLLRQALSVPVRAVDESYTTVDAATVDSNGYDDAYAACAILERYFTEGPLENV